MRDWVRDQQHQHAMDQESQQTLQPHDEQQQDQHNHATPIPGTTNTGNQSFHHNSNHWPYGADQSVGSYYTSLTSSSLTSSTHVGKSSTAGTTGSSVYPVYREGSQSSSSSRMSDNYLRRLTRDFTSPQDPLDFGLGLGFDYNYIIQVQNTRGTDYAMACFALVMEWKNTFIGSDMEMARKLCDVFNDMKKMQQAADIRESFNLQ